MPVQTGIQSLNFRGSFLRATTRGGNDNSFSADIYLCIGKFPGGGKKGMKKKVLMGEEREEKEKTGGKGRVGEGKTPRFFFSV